MTEQEKKDAGTPPPKWLLRFFTAVNVLVYKLSNGRWMNQLSGMPIVLVEMTGARSGKKRTIPLMYVPHGESFLLVASQGGAPKHPVWYHNLVAHPNVKITYNGTTRQLKARLITAEEKQRLWPVCCEYYPPYEDYQVRTERQIPVFVCEGG